MKQLLVRDPAFYKRAAVLATPVVVQSMITIGVNMLDTIMLGSFGELQLSGSSLANSFISIYQVLCMGIGGGAAVLTAQYWGANDTASVRKILTLMLRISITIALLFTGAVLLIPAEIMRMYTDDPEIIENGVIYFRLVSPTFLLTGISLTASIVFRSVREVRLPLFTAILSFFTNLFFNWVLIFGHFGLPQMEIAGAALATTLARLIETAVVVVFMLRVDKRICYRVHHFFASCRGYLRTYLRYSVPVIVSDFLLGLGNTAVTMIIGHLGASFVTANAIVAMIVRLSTVFNSGFASAGSIMTGNVLGSGDAETAYRQGVTFTVLSFVIGVAAGGVILLLAPWIIGAYNITEETRGIAFMLIDAVSIMVVFQAMQSMLTKGVLRGGGDTRFLMIADIAFMWICSIPLGYLAAFVWHMSPFWIYILMKIDYIIKTIWCVFRLVHKKWIRMIAQDINKAPVPRACEPAGRVS